MPESQEDLQWENETIEIIDKFRKVPKKKKQALKLIDEIASSHHNDYKYYNPKMLNFDKIFSFIVERIRNQKITHQKQPEVMFVTGYPRSGKNTFIQQSFENQTLTKGTFHYDRGTVFDILKSDTNKLASFYKKTEDRRSRIDDLDTFSHLVTNELLYYALRNRANIVWKASYVGEEEREKLTKLEQLGYNVNLVHIDVARETAIMNNEKYDTHTQSYPTGYIKELIKALDQDLPEIKSSDIFKSVTTLTYGKDTNKKEFLTTSFQADLNAANQPPRPQQTDLVTRLKSNYKIF